MTESNTIPTLYLKDEYDLTALVKSIYNFLERNEGTNEKIRDTNYIYEFFYKGLFFGVIAVPYFEFNIRHSKL